MCINFSFPQICFSRNLGLVLESFELTDEPDEDSIKAGELRVAWYPLGRDEIVKEHNVSPSYVISEVIFLGVFFYLENFKFFLILNVFLSNI